LLSRESTPTPTSLPTSSSTPPRPLPTGDRPLLTSAISCPEAEGYAYDVPGSDKSFVIFCGIDFSADSPSGSEGGGGTVELGFGMAGDMEACVALCAANKACTACGWGYIAGDESRPGQGHRCWMKGE